jgi:hypothetical protein
MCEKIKLYIPILNPAFAGQITIASPNQSQTPPSKGESKGDVKYINILSRANIKQKKRLP